MYLNPTQHRITRNLLVPELNRIKNVVGSELRETNYFMIIIKFYYQHI
jgi:hypothetical protein